MLLKGEFGAIHADLLGLTDRRDDVWRISALSLGIVSVVDHIVDEHCNLPTIKSQLIEATLKAIQSRKQIDFDDSQVKGIERACHTLHDHVMKASQAELFFQQFQKLAQAAQDQINHAGSFEIQERVGGETCCLGVAVPAIYLDEVPIRLMSAARHLGAIVQLVDDLDDWHHDRAMSIKTGATSCARLEDAFEQSFARIDQHFEVLNQLTTTSERKCYGSLVALGAIKWPLLSRFAQRLLG